MTLPVNHETEASGPTCLSLCLSADIYVCVCVCVCVSVAPGSAPMNIQARPISSSSVVVEWNEPLIPNGIIKVPSLYLPVRLVASSRYHHFIYLYD